MGDHRPPAHGETFIGAGLDTWAGSPFVQARLALLGKTVFLLSFGFFAVINCVLIVGGGVHLLPSLVTQANVMHFLSSSVMGVVGDRELQAVVTARARSSRRR